MLLKYDKIIFGQNWDILPFYFCGGKPHGGKNPAGDFFPLEAQYDSESY